MPPMSDRLCRCEIHHLVSKAQSIVPLCTIMYTEVEKKAAHIVFTRISGMTLTLSFDMKSVQFIKIRAECLSRVIYCI